MISYFITAPNTCFHALPLFGLTHTWNTYSFGFFMALQAIKGGLLKNNVSFNPIFPSISSLTDIEDIIYSAIIIFKKYRYENIRFKIT